MNKRLFASAGARPSRIIRSARHLAVALCLASQGAWAADESIFSISGFGTLGLTHSSEDQADFIAHDLQGGGAGRDHEWSFDVDSKVGIQLTGQFTEQLSGVVQILSTQAYDGTYRPGVEWANVKYDITPDLSVRAGRIVLGTFLASDYRNVGYSLPWVRPPVEVYSLIPLTHSDGIDASYRLQWGDASHLLQAGFGNTSSRAPEGAKAESKDGWLFSDTVQYGRATFRAVYTRSKFRFDMVDPIFEGYRELASGLRSNPVLPFLPAPMRDAVLASADQADYLADKYELDGTSDFIGFGFNYDPGNWFLMSEWGQTNTHSVLGKREAWYISAGYRFGPFTPYATYSQANLKTRSSDPGVSLPAFLGGTPAEDGAAQANAGLNEALGNAPEQKTVSVGMRWDFMKNAAFKLQYDHSRLGDNSPGTLDHQTPQFRPGGRFDVWSATIDFVF